MSGTAKVGLRVAVVMACLVLAADSRAAQVRLAWDPPTNNVDGTLLTDLAGYKLCYGTASGNYTVTVDVGNVTTTLVANLVEGHTYYFAGKSYNTDRAESDYATELVYQVPDMTPPVITPPESQTLAAGGAGTAVLPNLVPLATVTDNVSTGVNLVVTQSPVAGTAFGPGTTTVTLTARDEAGNAAQAVVQVTVVDQTPPVIQTPAPVTVTAGADDKAPVPDFLSSLVVSDNCTPKASLVLTQTPAEGTRVGVGTTVATVRAVDTAGNVAQATVAFTVQKNNAAPVVSAGPDVTCKAGQSVTLAGTVTDDGLPSGSSLTVSWAKVSGPGTVKFGSPRAATTTVSIGTEGTYVLRLTASDGALSASDDVTVVVQPKTAPSKPTNVRKL